MEREDQEDNIEGKKGDSQVSRDKHQYFRPQPASWVVVAQQYVDKRPQVQGISNLESVAVLAGGRLSTDAHPLFMDDPDYRDD